MQNWESTLASQYANSPALLAVIKGMNDSIDPTARIDDFYRLVWNVDTAVGHGLDVWGRIRRSNEAARADALASRYAELVPDGRLRKKIFKAIETEWQRTVEALGQITGEKHRLAGNPGLARSMKHRFPYIDPLHHLQLELIRRYRLGQAGEKVQRGIHLSINGISAALRNTG